MSTIPKLALIPSGVKATKVYSVLPTDGSGDFDFTRSGSATRVNSEGLIELVSTNVPRLNYPLIDGVVQGCPSLLLEPQRSNLIPYSEDFDNAVWAKNQSSITPNATISPDGTLNASKLIEDSSSNFHRITQNVNTTNGTFSHSVFAKAGERKYFVLRNNISGSNLNACFDLENGVVVYNGFNEAKIENYGNGWYRCSIIEICTFDISATFSLMTSNNEVTSNSIPSYQGDGTSGVYIWGAQFEAGSYPTSYIPNFGTALGVTRVADTCNGAGNSQVFNDSEGVIYVETQPFIDGDYQSLYISLSDNTTGSNFITIQHRNIGQLRVYAGNFTTIIYLQDIDMSQNLKIALQYKNVTDFKLYINGTLCPIYSTPTNSAFVGLSTLDFKLRGSSSGYWAGQVRETKYFDTALTDAELISLTTL